MEPIVLPPNQLHRFYKGGAQIAELRSTGSTDDYAPEEWIASMASPFGEPGVGVSRLSDGRSLADVVAADPEGMLGSAHVDAFGPDVAVLIKLLDAGERLPVHLHPDDAFARAHLGSRYGKTEAWIILAGGPDAAVWVGLRDEIDANTLRDWVERQDRDALLGALHRVPVAAGDTVFVSAGTMHAIGETILLAELQQPTDFSILLEYEGFVGGAEGWHLGLGPERALAAVDRSAWGASELERARSKRNRDALGIQPLFPAEADAFFRADRIRPRPTLLHQEFSVLLVVDGSGTVIGDGWKFDLARGDVLLVPYSAGACELAGDVDVLRCRAPDPSAKN